MASPGARNVSLAIFFASWLLLSCAHANEVKGEARIIDGDTVEVSGVKVRLHGVDAPEIDQKCGSGGDQWECGQVAKRGLAAFIGRKKVTCVAEKGKQDPYGRIIAKCSAGREDLGGWMVSSGLAWASRKHSSDYVVLEAAAKAQGRGVWAGGGEAQSPREFRTREQYAAHDSAVGSDSSCGIKGNINSKKKKIYHMPGSKWYSRTRIDTKDGECWFCSREEAEAAGWRAAR